MRTASDKYYDRIIGITDRYSTVCARRNKEARTEKERKNILNGRLRATFGVDLLEIRETLKKANEILG